MLKSKQYVLRRLDGWYGDMYRRNYTDEIARDVAGYFSRELGADEELTRLYETLWTKEYQVELSGSFFSGGYANLEAFLEGVPVEGVSLEEIPSGITEPYEPILREFRRLKQFVNRARNRAAKIFPEDLSNEDINQAFLEAFGDHQGFAEFRIACMNAMPLSDVAVSTEDMPKETFDMEVRFKNVFNGIIPYLSEKIFGDLSSDS